MVLNNWQCDKDGLQTLTPAQKRVAEFASLGWQDKEIAQMLCVSQRTIESHLNRAYSRLNIKNRIQLISYELSKSNSTSLAPRRYYSSLINLKFTCLEYRKVLANKQKRLRIALAINHLKYKCRFNLVSSKREWLKELDELIEVVVQELNDF